MLPTGLPASVTKPRVTPTSNGVHWGTDIAIRGNTAFVTSAVRPA